MGTDECISLKVGEGDVTIELCHFVGAEVTAGYVAFRPEGIHLSIVRWVPDMAPAARHRV